MFYLVRLNVRLNPEGIEWFKRFADYGSHGVMLLYGGWSALGCIFERNQEISIEIACGNSAFNEKVDFRINPDYVESAEISSHFSGNSLAPGTYSYFYDPLLKLIVSFDSYRIEAPTIGMCIQAYKELVVGKTAVFKLQEQEQEIDRQTSEFISWMNGLYGGWHTSFHDLSIMGYPAVPPPDEETIKRMHEIMSRYGFTAGSY